MYLKHLKFTLAVILLTIAIPTSYLLAKLIGRPPPISFSEIKGAYLEIRDDIYFN
jgi:hypothetical protein